jgi:NADH dehydrogenase/NADH:ubiquinone oxidoreductase subunit G
VVNSTVQETTKHSKEHEIRKTQLKAFPKNPQRLPPRPPRLSVSLQISAAKRHKETQKKRKTGWKAILTDRRKKHKQSLMKTTIDLPDELLQRAEATAVQGKTTVKDLLIRGLNHAIDSTAESEELNRGERAERLLAALQGRNTEPVGPLRREELYDRTQ